MNCPKCQYPNAETLCRLDRIGPGFTAWAHALESHSRQPAHSGKTGDPGFQQKP